MSIEKDRRTALKWFETAKSDLDASRLLSNYGKHAHSCFHSHQAAEKAVKALWYLNSEDPWGHSVQKLIDHLQHVNLEFYGKLNKLIKDAKLLDRFYIPTRYPNGLPDITPDMAYDEDDSKSCIEKAENILKTVEEVLG
ncbi:MAG: HEPN domain-containing protein [Nitrospirota bacterium]